MPEIVHHMKRRKKSRAEIPAAPFFADEETVGPEPILWFRDTQCIRETDNLYGKRHHTPIH